VLLVLLLAFRHFAEAAQRRLTDALRFLPEAQFLRAERLVAAFVRGVESTRSDTALVQVLVYSAIEWISILACFWCLAKAFPNITFTIVDIVIFVGFVAFGAVIQLPGIGGGWQIASIVVLTELFKIRLEVASTFTLVSWFTTNIAVAFPGLWLALREGLNWRSLRQIEREVSV